VKLRFAVTTRDDVEEIGKGTHERVAAAALATACAIRQ
jgi:hypothetical protein